jgi:gamma-glutamyltranspeptidase/glutathione hydrolase
MLTQTRPDAYSDKAVVSSSSLQASLTGRDIMSKGGNVFDAAIATSAVLCVTQNNLCGLGGDMFALLRRSGKSIVDINGSGRSSHNANISYFEERGLGHIPERGPLSAITVPGLVDGWREIHEKYCTMELRELLAPAISLAENGFPVTAKYNESLRNSFNILKQYSWADLFAPNSNLPQVGSMFRQKFLAETLKLISSDGPDTFYRGYLSDRIISGLKDTGVLLDEEDFRKHRTTAGQPLKSEYHAYNVYETSPNSQGVTLLLWLNLLSMTENRGNTNPEDRLSPVLESGMRAYMERYRITDPDFHRLPADFLDRSFASALLERDVPRGKTSVERSEQGDTTYFCIADADGNSVSMIQSNYMGFGSGISPAGTGFILQNRGCYFTLNSEHNNALVPDKRTFHTLSAAMIEKDGDFRFALGTMGGDIQPQVHMQLIQDLLVLDMDPQSSLDRPRWAFPHTIYETPSRLEMEPGALKDVSKMKLYGLIPYMRDSFSSIFGHAQIVGINRYNVVIGGADPRGDGGAIPVL